MTLASDSMPTFFSVVDMDGKRLGGDQILGQLKSKTPVLISASGHMPPACYLRLPSHADLIVLLGPTNKQDVANKTISADKGTKKFDDLKEWTEEKSQRYFFSLMQRSRSFKIETSEEASKYLRGIWRLVKQAHIGGGHYVRADRGEDVTVICTDEWLLVRLGNAEKESDNVSNFSRIEADERGHLHVKVNNSVTFDHFQPLDENHMAVLSYDFIAVVQRIGFESPKPTKVGDNSGEPERRGDAAQNDSDAVAATKAHLRALLRADKDALRKSYASKVRLLSKDDSLDREKVIARAMKMFAGGSDQFASMFFRRLSFEELKVTEGEFAAGRFASPRPTDGEKLRFQIKTGDAVVRVSQQSAYWYMASRSPLLGV